MSRHLQEKGARLELVGEKAFQEEGTARAKAPRAAGRTGVAAGRSLDSVEALPGEWPVVVGCEGRHD